MHLLVFFYGFLAACFALLCELLLFSLLPTSFYPFAYAAGATVLPYAFIGLFLFALIEEASRFTFFVRFRKNLSLSLEQNSWLIPSLLFGAGFGMVEALFGLMLASLNLLSLQVFVLHVALTVLLGWGILRESSFSRKPSVMLLSAVLLHLAYNLFVFWN